MTTESRSADTDPKAQKTSTTAGLGAPTRARNQSTGGSSEKTRFAAQPKRTALAAAKRRNYAALRARGVGTVRAVRRSGYRPGSRHTARAQALKLDRVINLHDAADLERALIEAGVTFGLVARAIKRGLENRRTCLDSLSLLGKWMGWDRPRPVASTTNVLDAISDQDLMALRQDLQRRVMQLRAEAIAGVADPPTCRSSSTPCWPPPPPISAPVT